MRAEYAELKYALAALLVTDRAAYTAGKTDLIASVLRRNDSDLPASPDRR